MDKNIKNNLMDKNLHCSNARSHKTSIEKIF